MNDSAVLATSPKAVKGGTAERDFRPDIQGLRALAVAMVVIYHLYPSLLPGGFVGVDVFFVISGFLITGHLWRGYQRTGKVGLVDFWGRRAKRLVPAATLVLTVTWVASRLVLPATRLADTADQVRASALYFQNWLLAHNAVDYLKSTNLASPVQHFWSLSVEEQFYLVWPWLFLAAAILARLRARHRGPGVNVGLAVATGLAGALVLGSLAYSVYDTRTDPAEAYFVTTTRVWELGLGGLLALLPQRLGRPLSRQGWLGWAGLAAMAASPFLLRGTSAFPGAIALLPVVGTVALIAGGSAAARYGPARLTSVRPMVFLGGISYSLYLWHWPVIVLWSTYRGHKIGPYAGLPLAVAAVVLSWLTKVWVEDKVRLARPLARRPSLSVCTALAAALPVALVWVFIAAQPAPWNGRLGPRYPGAAVLADMNVAVPAAPVLPPPNALSLPAYWRQGCLDGKYAGISVVAIRETPDVGLDEPECVVSNPSSPSKCDVPTAKAIMRHPPSEYAARLAGVPVIDMNQLICGPQECPAVVGNVLVYQDAHHLTWNYSLTMAPFLEQQLLKADKSLAATPA